MKATFTNFPSPRHPSCGRALCAAALVLFVSAARSDPIFGVIDGPIDLLADVTQAVTPGDIVFSDNQRVLGAIAGPKQTAEFLHLVPAGRNLSGRTPGVRTGFASALAESDGNGGVGVSNVLFGPHLDSAQTSTADLVSQSVWRQTFVHAGLGPANISLHLEIPPIELGLFGAAPARSRPNSAETAQAIATLTTFITRANGNTSEVLSFDYGMEVHEEQLPRPGTGFFSNTVVASGLGQALDSKIEEGEISSIYPIFTLPAFSGDVLLGTLDLGDELTYVYTLQARGTTNAGERGYHAFIGDPFGVDVVDGNLRSTIELAGVVPEPGTWALGLIGITLLAWRLTHRPGAAPVQSG